MHLGVGRVDVEDPQREHLLAVPGVRRDLESLPTSDSRDGTVAAMTGPRAGGETTRADTIRALHELVEALDRRLPQVDHVGEVSIARDAAALRAVASKRVEELEREAASDTGS